VPFYQLDASAIVKRYVAEAGSGWIRRLAAPGSRNNISIAEVTRVEVASALARREREGSLSATERARLLSTFEAHCAARYRLVPTEHHVVDHAVDLIGHHRLRAYDAIQLATAIVVSRSLLQYGLPSLSFVSADNELLLAAGAEGLATENPNLHP
jgi:predicted nucleic acid-binding protein